MTSKTEELTTSHDELVVLVRELAHEGVRIDLPAHGELADAIIAIGTDGRELLVYWDEADNDEGWCWRTRRWDDAENYYVDHDGDPLDSRGELAGLLRDLVS
jgi:hypothetical protein